ncbi:glycosyltransferase family 4 protein [Formosa haliotis]|uniref:glycosyltransferase family 4 protein n=1 Tax=Formosa haliotis TaxID=1555194 RepID=UPI00082499A3|nr:glycosyltransferase family 4 protein [Formosa haliotis]
MFKKIKHQFRLQTLKKKLQSQKRFLDSSVWSKSGPSILIIDGNIPEYNKDSGSRRLLELMKILLKEGYNVYLMADLKEYKYKSDYISFYKNMGVHVYEPSLDAQGELITRNAFLTLLAPHLDVVWLHRPETFNTYYKLVKSITEKALLVYDMVDFHYLRNLREWELNKEEKLKVKAEKYLKLELENCQNADKIVVISDKDKVALSEYYKDTSKMVTLGNVHEFLPKGKDFVPFAERSELLFVGGFGHKPNIDAVIWLNQEIMPIVWESLPDLKINIVGSHPPQDLLDLNSEKFKVIGFVDDISSYYKTAKLFVAPLRFGAGVKGKIGQSFEYSLPVITTDVGAEGFNFSPFKQDMVGNSAAHIAQLIIQIVIEEGLWTNISAKSEQFIAPYSLKTIETQLKTIVS